jgi:hypothetical protein
MPGICLAIGWRCSDASLRARRLWPFCAARAGQSRFTPLKRAGRSGSETRRRCTERQTRRSQRWWAPPRSTHTSSASPARLRSKLQFAMLRSRALFHQARAHHELQRTARLQSRLPSASCTCTWAGHKPEPTARLAALGCALDGNVLVAMLRSGAALRQARAHRELQRGAHDHKRSAICVRFACCPGAAADRVLDHPSGRRSARRTARCAC